MDDNKDSLKLLTARSVKWNLIDRVSSQLLYGVTGIILARLLSEEEFGLVGAIMVFQAFAQLFVDSGFYCALIQRKDPTRLDYSTVLWFNLGIAIALYAILYLCAPLIAGCYGGEQRLIPLSRVMFLSFILHASTLVQTNRLMKRMEVKMVAVANVTGLMAGAAAGVWLAFSGYGAWAIVWQTIVLSGVKSLVLWLTSGWLPLLKFSWSSLRSFMSVGSGMLVSSFLNIVFQNIYSFFIGNRAGMAPLGYYTQADKWSKMGIASISQVINSSFLPTLSQVQDEPERFARVSSKMNRFTAYILFPAMGFLAVMATPVFHCLFGTKWDPSIILFQLLLLRGIFTVLTALYNNYLIAKARTRTVVTMEAIRDGLAIVFLIASIPVIAITSETDKVLGIKILLYGQLVASAIAWGAMTFSVAKVTGRPLGKFLADNVPYLVQTAAICAILWAESLVIENCWILVFVQAITALVLYLAVNRMLDSTVQKELLQFVFRKK